MSNTQHIPAPILELCELSDDRLFASFDELCIIRTREQLLRQAHAIGMSKEVTSKLEQQIHTLKHFFSTHNAPTVIVEDAEIVDRDPDEQQVPKKKDEAPIIEAEIVEEKPAPKKTTNKNTSKKTSTPKKEEKPKVLKPRRKRNTPPKQTPPPPATIPKE